MLKEAKLLREAISVVLDELRNSQGSLQKPTLERIEFEDECYTCTIYHRAECFAGIEGMRAQDMQDNVEYGIRARLSKEGIYDVQVSVGSGEKGHYAVELTCGYVVEAGDKLLVLGGVAKGLYSEGVNGYFLSVWDEDLDTAFCLPVSKDETKGFRHDQPVTYNIKIGRVMESAMENTRHATSGTTGIVSDELFRRVTGEYYCSEYSRLIVCSYADRIFPKKQG